MRMNITRVCFIRPLKTNCKHMKNLFNITTLTLTYFTVLSCQTSIQTDVERLEKDVDYAAHQILLQVEQVDRAGKILNPRSFENGEVKYVDIEDWTSGFFPGTLWLLYELTGDSAWRAHATRFTEELDSVKYLTHHHDIGFMIQCSYGHGFRLGEPLYGEVILQAAKSLTSRFRPLAGILQSWDVDQGWMSKRGWECPVIIDNMMNLELLFNATTISGDSSFYKIAITHADQTIKNHYRSDYSCYHVVDYSLANGTVRSKETAQGYSDASSWARGQAWGIYGFTICYRATKDPRYLEQAQNAVSFVINHPNFSSDFVPYWDFNAPNIPDEPRDVSSAAILASALYELSTYTTGSLYREMADKIIASLSTEHYRARHGENGNFLLKHSVGSIPHGVEIDVPLNYADYYYLEALLRKRSLISNP